jgi:hypothetical protein
MDLSTLLTTITLGTLFYAGGQWVYGAYIAPWRAARAPESVKRKPRRLGFKKRSPRSNVQNAVNVGSGQQEAKEPAVNVPNVQPPPAAPAPAAAPGTPAGEGFTLSPRELIQLSEALNLYREGANVEQAVCRAFGVTKGGSEGWRRAKALFDAATVPPGAAPAGTYAAPAPVARRRRAGAR